MDKDFFSEEARKVNFEPMANILKYAIDENIIYLFCLTRSGYPYLRRFESVLKSKGIEPYSVVLKPSPDYAENGYKPVLGFVENPENFKDSPVFDISELKRKKSSIAIGFDDIINLGRYAAGSTLYILSRAKNLGFSKYLLAVIRDGSELYDRKRISHISYASADDRPIYGYPNSLINHIRKLATESSKMVDFSLIHPPLGMYEDNNSCIIDIQYPIAAPQLRRRSLVKI